MQYTTNSSQQLKRKMAIPGAIISSIGDLSVLTGAKQLSLDINSKVESEEFSTHPIGIISNGVVGLQHSLNDGRRSISSLFFCDDMLDFRLSDKVSGTFVCFAPVELTLFKVEEIERLCLENPQVLDVLFKSHLKAWGDVISHSVDLARKSAVEKLASFIFECQGRCANTRQNTIHLILKRIDIADYLGLRPETLCRAFAKLRQNDLIEFDNTDHIHICNETALQKVARGGSIETLSG